MTVHRPVREPGAGFTMYEECRTQEVCTVDDGLCLVCGMEAVWWDERPADLFDDSEPEETKEYGNEE